MYYRLLVEDKADKAEAERCLSAEADHDLKAQE
jgi:hypothetical protein